VLTTPGGKQIVLAKTTPIADVNTKAMANKLWDE
jgi:hypothetical protein